MATWPPTFLNKPGRRAARFRLRGIADFGRDPWIPSAAQCRFPRPHPGPLRPMPVLSVVLGLTIAFPQTTGPPKTSNPELTQLAREKTPSTAPMVTLVMEVADLEVS